ncbi:hypothetical protein M8J77_022919 [Diaphorina citri]|nr:hypothetical protein M8J77_022919 [Diaphorina citri]
MKVKEVDKTVNVTWSPETLYPIYLATGTAAQQLDASFNTSASLEIYSLNLDEPGLDLEQKCSLSSENRYHTITWGEYDTAQGFIMGGCDDGIIQMYNVDNIMSGDNKVDILSKKHSGPVRALDFNKFQPMVCTYVCISQLSEGVRPQVKPKKRWADIVKDDMKKCNIDVNVWRTLAADRTKWRDTIQSETIKLHKTNIEEKKQKRTARHAEEEKFDWNCPLCNFTRTGRTGRQYVASHLSQKHPREMEECRRNRSLKCTMCNFEARSLSGLQSHNRNKHPTFQSRDPKPIRLRAATTSTTGSVPPPLPPPRNPRPTRGATVTRPSSSTTCPTCTTPAGLASHLRAATCQRRGNGGSLQTTSDR